MENPNNRERETSLTLSAAIGKKIAEENPTIFYTADDLSADRASFSREDLFEMAELGLYDGDFEKFYVIREFCSQIGLGEAADGYYLLRLFEKAKKLSASAFLADPYLVRVGKISSFRSGDVLLTTASYRRGEILQYDMPDFRERLVVPSLGFFTRDVAFPALYEGSLPWMSVCPSEISSMAAPIEAAFGRVLVLGLGLGYYAFHAASKAEVTGVTVVEKNPRVIEVFEKQILPRFPKRGCADKLRVVEADAFAYLENLRGGEYDFCFADIWEGAVDGAPLYTALQPHAARLSSTRFSYWIEEAIRAYLEEN